MGSVELLLVSVFGLFFFLIEEIENSYYYFLPTIAILITISLIYIRYVLTNSFSNMHFAVFCFCIGLMTAVIRVGIVYGGYVSFLNNVHPFNMQFFHHFSYILFGISGGIAGYIFYDKHQIWKVSVCSTIGIILGIVYHLRFAEGFYFRFPSIEGAIILLFEFFSPVIYTSIILWYVGFVSRKLSRA